MRQDIIDDTLKKHLKLTLLIVVALSLINKAWGFGYGLGVLFYQVVFLIKRFYIDYLLLMKKFSLVLFILFFGLGLIGFSIPFVIAVILPNWFNVIAVAAGLVSFPYTIYVSFIKGGG